MKFLPSVVSYFLKGESTRQNIRMLLRFFLALFVMITAYSVIFHLLMAAEGQRHSWITGLYWTMVVMSTLGFGDITFHSDVGRIFSILVLLSGVIFLLILLPFAFITTSWNSGQALFTGGLGLAALFSITVAFIGIWFFSITDKSSAADEERARFYPQFVRSQTGLGASGASAH